MKLTDREKKLAFVFACVLVLTVSYYNYRLKADEGKKDFFVAADEGKADSKELESAEAEMEEATMGGSIYVDIGGCVQNPGLYELEKGARVKDGITAAGGIVGNADTSQINLAKKLNDEEKLYIPKVGENAPQGVATPESSGGPVSIQNGSKEELMSLPGVGEKTADKIIEYRTAHPFTAVEDLKEVPGIGEKTFDSLKNNIRL
ncbi:MAG: ComEA family DNA-binding protein [Peptoniphilus sp.]|nr:ComEA family DNA-binding protein [Peptoniphilus sp.]MDY3118560.1 ComEA family DNA-binding protein [Peptoniphilus sp.]